MSYTVSSFLFDNTFKSVIMKMFDAYVLHRVIYDEGGAPCDLEYVDINPAFEGLIRLPRTAVIGKKLSELSTRELNAALEIIKLHEMGEIGRSVMEANKTFGNDRWYEVNSFFTEPGYFVAIFHDVTESRKKENTLQDQNEEINSLYEELTASDEELRAQFDMLTLREEQLRSSEERYRLASEAANDILWDADILHKKYHLSERWYEITGYEPPVDADESTTNRHFKAAIHPDDLPVLERAEIECISGKTDIIRCEFRILDKSGKYLWFYNRGKVLKDATGKITMISGSFTDVTELKNKEFKLQESYQELEATYEELTATQEELSTQYEELRKQEDQLEHMAFHDSLTGLRNRQCLYIDIAHGIEEQPFERKAILYIDTDNLKYINDTLGHPIGDELIRQTGVRLKSMCGADNEIYRLGGDEFVIYMHQYHSKTSLEAFSKQIIDSFQEPFLILGYIIRITASIGIAVYPEHGTSVEDVLKYADMALYKAKAIGRNRAVFYRQEMREVLTERMLMEAELRTAMEQNEFQVYYQPQLDIETNDVSGFEALLRWNNPKLGSVPPDKFIRVAEDTHLIIPIGDWVMKEACSFLKKLHNIGFEEMEMSVNVSIIQLMQEDFCEKVFSVINTVGLNPCKLELEITESILMESYEQIRAKLECLRTRGVKIALDDFGQGYSSLSSLRNLPITTLKIDKIFTDGITIFHDDKALTDVIVQIGRKMGLNVVAEGVETKEQMDYLIRHHCNKIQGFYFSRPLPGSEAERILNGR